MLDVSIQRWMVSFWRLSWLLFAFCVCQESASSAWEDIVHMQHSRCLKLAAEGIMDIGLGIPVPHGRRTTPTKALTAQRLRATAKSTSCQLIDTAILSFERSLYSFHNVSICRMASWPSSGFQCTISTSNMNSLETQFKHHIPLILDSVDKTPARAFSCGLTGLQAFTGK